MQKGTLLKSLWIILAGVIFAVTTGVPLPAGAITPTIDGQINPGEWDGAVSTSIILEEPYGPGTVDGTLYFTRDSGNLYIGLVVESIDAGITWFYFNDQPNDNFEPYDDALQWAGSFYDYHLGPYASCDPGPNCYAQDDATAVIPLGVQDGDGARQIVSGGGIG